VYAGLPNLVSDRDLPEANGILQTADNLTWTVGGLAGGALVAATSPDIAYLVNAISFGISAVLILRIRERFEEAEPEPGRGGWRDLTEGLALAVHSRALLTVLAAWSVVMLAQAGINVSEVFLAKTVFDGGDFGYGLLVAATGLGLVLGSLFGGTWITQRGLTLPYSAAIALMALGLGAAAVAPNVWVAAAVIIVAGAGNGVAVIANALLVQRGAPDRLRGRAFSVVMSVGYAVLGLGMIAAGPLTNAIGARGVWGIAAGLTAVGALAAFVLVRGVATTVRPAEALPASD
jgi:Na+/melibiose symporter-like transporter